MLVLSRKRDEEIVIMHQGVEIRVCVVDRSGEKIRIGINAPQSAVIYRAEVLERVRSTRAGQESGSNEVASRQEL